jgi:hypothetical protein|tara:strand:+ start:140 stop:421 length:282 start_codon:yes stop_codon:yes gene_type:complete
MSEIKEYDNDNQAAVWKNERKVEPWQASFNGNATIAGVEYFIDVMVTSKEDLEKRPKMPRMKMKFKEKNQAAQEAPKAATPPADNFFDDDIPF